MPEIIDGHLIVDFKVLLVQLNLGSSLRENCYLLHPCLCLGHHPTLHQYHQAALAAERERLAEALSHLSKVVANCSQVEELARLRRNEMHNTLASGDS